MKTLFIIPLVLMSLVSFPSWGLSMDDLVEREGLYFQKFTDIPFTGEIDEGLTRGNYKDGQRDGTWVNYHENGQLRYKGEYNNGNREGSWVFFNKDGTKRMSENKVGEIIFDEGSGVYRNGKKVSD